ncbi:uncharacterized protein SOCE26_018000 [Sorangium cellulosum]|uniref:Peroxidase n=1 Tax=Sorangium cellulosum TaxID=56 RepID=A0A2L0EM80_SORCE|nr:hypothetical protein [Sorangium cellulosum]AUX40399.1 uncharacterized protein SOCE26_018000 [Sorangium cellulosum]
MKQAKKDQTDAVEVDDVQGLVVYGYGHLPIARYVFVSFTKAAKIGAWLGEIVEQTPSARRREKGAPRPSTAVHIALASSGLKQIGLSDEERATFSYHFIDGMANLATQRTLGDFGDNAPETWDFGGPNTPPIDALLLLFATTEEEVEALLERHRDRMSELGIEVVTVEKGYRRDDGKEHFGFLDGVSQPHILGGGREPEAGDVALHPGELLLGYTDEYAEISATPTVGAKADPEAILAPHPDDDTQRDLGRNGSYLVYRKYQQYTSKFWGFVWESAQPRDGQDKDAAAVMLASKMVGRWPSGAPVTLTPDRDAPELVRDVPPFTRLRGGGYYFLPGLRAVRYLAWRASNQPGLLASPAKPQPRAEAG